MAVRTTIDLPDDVHERLRREAAQAGTSMKQLIVKSVVKDFPAPRRKRLLRGPFLKGKGPGGPRFPVDETPYDLLLP
jgi:hypothetical protein